MTRRIFVFGSNEAGLHGAGAARTAQEKFGAIYGKSYGHYGDSFAIPTKDMLIETLPLSVINQYVQGFLAYADAHYKREFKITQIGCGLAGYKPADIAPLFRNATKNCLFDTAWQPYLNRTARFWGTK